jgi:hypothetical protein
MDVSRLRRKGILFILSAPSGAGKTTISTAALRSIEALEMSISLTTRSPRAGEKDGQHYTFVSREEFERRRDRGELAEWAEVHGSLYGTPKPPIDAAIAEGRDMLLDIDVQGAEQMKLRYERGGGLRPAALRGGAREAPARPRYRFPGGHQAPARARQGGNGALPEVRLLRRESRRAGKRRPLRRDRRRGAGPRSPSGRLSRPFHGAGS